MPFLPLALCWSLPARVALKAAGRGELGATRCVEDVCARTSCRVGGRLRTVGLRSSGRLSSLVGAERFLIIASLGVGLLKLNIQERVLVGVDTRFVRTMRRRADACHKVSRDASTCFVGMQGHLPLG